MVSLVPAAGSRIAVAGGCGGMGRVLVRAALELGLRVAVLDLPRSLEEFPVPDGVLGVACDATSEDAVGAAFAAVGREWGALDSLVNFVGFTNERRTIEAMPLGEWNEIITGSLTSAFLLAHAAIPLLRNGTSPSIVSTSSTFGVTVSMPGFGPYAVAKAGVINLTRVLARELGPDIRVNAIAPGITQTAFLDGGTGREAKAEKTNTQAIANVVPLKRIAQPEDMVGPILFLIGPGAEYVNAQTLHVNGGHWS